MGKMPGPLMICIAGLHGNEQVGVEALATVIDKINHYNIPFRGHLVGIQGNIPALRENRRFIDYDMNRAWTNENVDRIISGGILNGPSEDRELREVLNLVDRYKQKEYPIKIMVDLHATSSDRGNFIVVPEDEALNPVVRALHLPVVLDLNKFLEGTMIDYHYRRGFTALTFEGGLIGSPEAVVLHESGLWEVLDAAGCITHHDHEDIDFYAKKLLSYAENLPRIVKTQYLHSVTPDDGFEMVPGYLNFQAVVKGEHLANDRTGPIYAPMDGLIFMPLYQKEGNDGFFIVHEVEAAQLA